MELQTIVLEIENILNNRPLCAVYNDTEEVLTPNHLIFGRRLDLDNINGDQNLVNDVGPIKLKRNLDGLLRHFWNLWRKDYLTSLSQFQ